MFTPFADFKNQKDALDVISKAEKELTTKEGHDIILIAYSSKTQTQQA